MPIDSRFQVAHSRVCCRDGLPAVSTVPVLVRCECSHICANDTMQNAQGEVLAFVNGQVCQGTLWYKKLHELASEVYKQRRYRDELMNLRESVENDSMRLDALRLTLPADVAWQSGQTAIRNLIQNAEEESHKSHRRANKEFAAFVQFLKDQGVDMQSTRLRLGFHKTRLHEKDYCGDVFDDRV